jgi:hypothetical protein
MKVWLIKMWFEGENPEEGYNHEIEIAETADEALTAAKTLYPIFDHFSAADITGAV